ncbi:unnamed protein product [Alternaria alternata]
MSADGQTSRVVPPSRRRDKPILSCTLCRRRNVHDRIDQLEKLVTNLIGGNAADLVNPISELREHLDQIPTSTIPRDEILDDVPGPELLFGRYPHATKEELLAALPPRSEADRFVNTFFVSMETHPTLIHKPTFLKRYNELWIRPFEAPTMWLGVLYAAFALGFRFQAAMDASQPSSSDLATDSVRMNFYREKAVQCMILANYTKTPPYTIEAFLLYFGTEFVRSVDSQFSVYMLVGMIVRLCFRMGYHRDPSRFPNISPYRGELRRRKWLVVMSLDLITSAQAGLPRMIMPFMYDTQEPRNLDEDDLHEDMLELPSSRPETELTQLLYSIILTRVRHLQARILDLVNTTSQPPYREINDIDIALRRVFDGVPQSSIASTVEDFGSALSPTSMRHLYLDLAFLKAELMLHRPYLVLGRTDARYTYSRRVCLNASIEMLDFQNKIDAEVQPGGKLFTPGWRLSTVSWYMSSVVAQDFLLATTVLVLELDADPIPPVLQTPESTQSEMRLDHAPPTREEIVASLRSAYRIWSRASKRSQEARKVATAVKLVLSRACNTKEQVADSAQTTVSCAQLNITSPAPSFDFSDPGSAVTAPVPFGMGNGAFGHPFDFGYMPMDLDQPNLPFDWNDVFSDIQTQPYGEYPPRSLF